MFMGFKMGLALTQEGLNNGSTWSEHPLGSAVAGPAPASVDTHQVLFGPHPVGQSTGWGPKEQSVSWKFTTWKTAHPNHLDGLWGR